MEFVAADSVEEALSCLAKRGDDVQVVAGGTDVMVQYMRGEISASAFLYIGKVGELSELRYDGKVEIGSLVTHRRLATAPEVAGVLPALAQAASTVGGWQTQEVGTLGGNLCNASPAADTVAPLLVADASVQLRSASGLRELPMERFLVDRRVTDRRPDELLTRITAEPLGPNAGEVYLKLGRRSAMEVAIVGLATRLSFDQAGRVTDARVAVCSVAPRPYRVTASERILVGTRLDLAAVKEASDALVDSARPIDDARASAAYRKRVLPGLLERAVVACRAQVFGEI